MTAEQATRKLRLSVRAAIRWQLDSLGEIENSLRKMLRLPPPADSPWLRRIHNWTYDPR